MPLGSAQLPWSGRCAASRLACARRRGGASPNGARLRRGALYPRLATVLARPARLCWQAGHTTQAMTADASWLLTAIKTGSVTGCVADLELAYVSRRLRRAFGFKFPAEIC